MDWLQFTILIFTVLGGAIYNNQRIEALQKESREESKDFHGRLCALEERYIMFMMNKKEEK